MAAPSLGGRSGGVPSVIYRHETVSEKRERAIRAYGADVVRTTGNYDDSSRRCSEDAGRKGWIVVSDTAEAADPGMALVVMQGYGVLVDELAEQLRGDWPTHVFLQGGCGGLAAAVRAHLATVRGERTLPFFVVVELSAAACLYRSAEAGERQVVRGNLDTVMAGLAVGQPSVPAWEILSAGADAFVTIPDEPALEAMRALADPPMGDLPVVAGETGAVGLGALMAIGSDTRARDALRLDTESRVLVVTRVGYGSRHLPRRSWAPRGDRERRCATGHQGGDQLTARPVRSTMTTSDRRRFLGPYRYPSFTRDVVRRSCE